jgi:NDP-sugar pyrophosphorylase family protein
MKLLVLAGGFGTRLQSVVAEVPKALAPVGKLPFLQLQINHWKTQGINSFVFLLHHQADLVISFLQKEKKTGVLMGCEVCWLVEPMPMDTGGAVAHAVEQLQLTGNFLVTNADTWLGTGIADVSQSESPAMAVVELPDAARYGRVQFDQRHRVTAFQEKNNKQDSGWINAGLCQLNAELFQGWDHLPFSLERLTFPAMVAGAKLKAVTLQTDFIDIGIPDDYFRFCRWIKVGRKGALCC